MNNLDFKQRCDQFMAGCFYAMIFFLPISTALLEWCMFLAFVGYLVKRSVIAGEALKIGHIKQELGIIKKCRNYLEYFKPLPSCINKPIAFLIFVNLITVIISIDPLLSIKAFLAKFLQSLFVYFTFIECMSTQKRLKVFLTVFFFSSILFMIDGLVQNFTGVDFIRGRVQENGRISSSFRQANEFGTYLVVIIAIFFSGVFFAKKARDEMPEKKKQFNFLETKMCKVGLMVSLLMAHVCLGLTYSRGAWIAFIIVVFLLGLKNFKAFISVSLIGAIFLITFMPMILKNREDWDTWELFFTKNNRITYWIGALPILIDYPVYGTGLNTYSVVEKDYDPEWGGYPHNCFLQMAVETGLIGLFSFLWIFFVLFKRSFRNLRNIQSQSSYAILFGFLIALIGYLIHASLDTTLYSVQMGNFLWIIVGFIVSFQNVLNENQAMEI